MLPFLKHKQTDAALSLPVETIHRDAPTYGMLDAVADDMMQAFLDRDRRRLRAALEALCAHVADADEMQDNELIGS